MVNSGRESRQQIRRYQPPSRLGEVQAKLPVIYFDGEETVYA